MTILRTIGPTLVLALLAACSASEGGGVSPDAHDAASADAGTVGGSDAADASGADATLDATLDASTDAAPDAGASDVGLRDADGLDTGDADVSASDAGGSSDAEDAVDPPDANDADQRDADAGDGALPDASVDTGTGGSDADAADGSADAAMDAGADGSTDVATDAGADGSADAATDAGADATPGGFGALSGECGAIDDELGADIATTVVTAIDFGADPFDDPADIGRLTEGGQAVLEAGNAGGSSLYSEVFAFEVLARCEGATLENTELGVRYRSDYSGPITDLVVRIDEVRLGVSVTRAVGFPRDAPYTVERATALLEDKLSDILSSTSGVEPSEAWSKQILHVIAYAEQHVDALEAALATIPAEISADTIVVITESRGMDEFLY